MNQNLYILVKKRNGTAAARTSYKILNLLKMLILPRVVNSVFTGIMVVFMIAMNLCLSG